VEGCSLQPYRPKISDSFTMNDHEYAGNHTQVCDLS
jgi:hypothetical protein